MKFMKKLLPVLLSATLLFQAVPVYAAQTAALPTLTVSEATKKAISRNENIRKSKESVILAEETEKNLRSQLFNTNSYAVTDALTLSLIKTDFGNALNIENIKAMEENVEFSVERLFIAIMNAEKDLALYDEEIAIALKDLEIARTKASLGLLSQVDFDKAQAEYDNMIIARITKENTIDSAYQTLNSLMGQKLENRYNISLNKEYKPLGKVNLTTHVSKFVNNSLTVKSAENDIRVAQYAYDTYETSYNVATYEITEYDVGRTEKEIALTQAKRALTTAKETVEENVKSTYNSILDLEASYDNLVLSLDTMNKSLDVMKVQLELGQITQLDYDKFVYEIAKVEEKLRVLVYSHEMLVTQFNSPNLLVAGAGSGSSSQSQDQ